MNTPQLALNYSAPRGVRQRFANCETFADVRKIVGELTPARTGLPDLTTIDTVRLAIRLIKGCDSPEGNERNNHV